jgi:hypothetical protein
MLVFALFALAVANSHHEHHDRRHHSTRKLTYVGGCTLKGPGAVQTTAGATENGAVDGVSVNTNIYKDGFWSVGCFGDEMLEKGDKYGDGKFAYSTQESANTSIVMYDELVERENQEAMTPQVCFDFCRSVPDMTFFGLTAGRDCYCAHYYKTKTGEGTCDLPCEGDSASICGGQTMSTIYQMHECVGQFAQEVGDLVDDSDDLNNFLDSAYYYLDMSAHYMQDSGDLLESYGEGSASPLSQAAKVAAAPISRAAEDIMEMKNRFDEVEEEFIGHQIDPAGDLTHDERKIVENMMVDTKELMDAAEQALAAGKAMQAEAMPTADGADAGSTYVPVLRQIDAEKEAFQTVCGGDLTGMPKVGLSYDQCAQACDSEAPKSSDDYCWAIQYFSFPEDEPLCFLFKGLNELTSYNCEYETASLISKKPANKGAFLEKKHHKKHHHKKHHHHTKVVRKHSTKVLRAEEHPMLSHPSTHYLMQARRAKFTSGRFNTDSPQATCAVRFADVNGVTPDMKDGITHIERCFASES